MALTYSIVRYISASCFQSKQLKHAFLSGTSLSLVCVKV